jgi:transcriptional regulator with XRE-family HTH domain
MRRTPTTILNSIAANVRAQRARRGLTQDGLADLLDIEPRYVRSIESGNANLSLALFLELAEALATSAEALLRPAKLVRRPRGRPASRPPKIRR